MKKRASIIATAITLPLLLSADIAPCPAGSYYGSDGSCYLYDNVEELTGKPVSPSISPCPAEAIIEKEVIVPETEIDVESVVIVDDVDAGATVQPKVKANRKKAPLKKRLKKEKKEIKSVKKLKKEYDIQLQKAIMQMKKLERGEPLSVKLDKMMERSADIGEYERLMERYAKSGDFKKVIEVSKRVADLFGKFSYYKRIAVIYKNGFGNVAPNYKEYQNWMKKAVSMRTGSAHRGA